MSSSNAKIASPKKTASATTKKRTKKPTLPPLDAQKIYDIATSFWASSALIAALKLGVFQKLADEALNIEVLARRLGSDRRWTAKLVVACAAMGFLTKQGDLFSNSPLAAQYLIAGKPHYQGDFLVHLGSLWERFGNLTETIKTGKRPDSQSTDRSDSESSRAWILSSHNIAMSGQAEALARTLDLTGRKHLCDVGGGPGTYAAVLCLRNPDLKATVLDDPEVIPVAQELIARAGLTERITVQTAQIDYNHYGDSYDVMLLSGVLHGYTEATCKKMLRKAFSSLEAGGLLVVQEMLLDDEEAKPLLPALFNLNMTVGASYTAAEIMKWIYEAGFIKAEVRAIEGAQWLDHVIIAKKP